MPPKVNKLKRQTKPKKQSNIQLQRNTQLQNQKVSVVVNLPKGVGVRKRKPQVNNAPKTLQQPIIKRIIQPTINLPANATDRSRPEANQFRNQELEYQLERFRNIQLREERLRKQSDDVLVADTTFATPLTATNMSEDTTIETRKRILELRPTSVKFPGKEADALRLLQRLEREALRPVKTNLFDDNMKKND